MYHYIKYVVGWEALIQYMSHIKRLLTLLAVTLLFATPLSSVLSAQAEPNLIANPSVETAANGNPANWTASKWGNNVASLTYANDGRTGSKSLRVEMSSRTDGDAKWMHNAVAVSANTSYTYSSYYKSNVATEIDIQYSDANGNLSYAYVQTVPASTEWTPLTAQFTTPAGATSATVMHIVADAGWLQTDDFLLAPTVTAPPSGNNLIGNPSMETADGNAPAGWLSNSWGTNGASFAYETSGRTGGRSVTATISSYTSGDAKWYAEPVQVEPGKTYTYSDYYRSTVGTRTVVAFIDNANTYSYHEVASAPAAASWSLYQTEFTAPATAAKATVFHLIDSIGSLTIDDVQLAETSSGNPGITVPNSSLEEGGSTPAGWQHNAWGTNNASFQYVTNSGHSGARSVKATINNYTSGDAKWYFDPIELTPGTQYRFTTWYKGTVAPHAVAMHLDANGNEQYIGMPDPQTVSSTEWQQYSGTLTIPQNAVATSVFLFVSGNGWLQTDDYAISEYAPTGFARPLVSLTFDDGHEDNTETALPIMESYGFKSTQCYATQFIEGMPQDIIDGVMEFYNSGHEICSHTVTHPFLTSLNGGDLDYELRHSQEYLESLIGEPVRNFASPYGDYNASVNDVIDNYYQAHRTVDEGFNSKDNFDIYRLRVQNILSDTTAAEVESWVQKAIADNTWLILVYHRVADDPGPYDAYTTNFAAHMQAIDNSGVTVKTYQAALEEILPQL